MLDKNKKLNLYPSSYYETLNFEQLRVFCHFNARYGLPTIELVDWLKKEIGDLKAIEIGAGSGDLGHHLGIPMTDNHCQEWPDVRLIYSATQQPLIKYGVDVERLDALEAIEKYKPDVVLGSWVTQWIDPNKPPPFGGGSVYGIKENLILERVRKYIVIGAVEIHKYKEIMKLPHKTYELPFLWSRRKDNRIWVWEN